MNEGIYLKLEALQSQARHLLLQKSLSESNRAFQKLANIEAYINQKDREWVSAPKAEITPFMQELITGDLANHLRANLIEFYQKKYGFRIFVEIFVTNKYGANVAQSGKTSDYRHDDEEWWQNAREKGYSVSAAGYDESSGERVIPLGLRIDDKGGAFTGVMKAVVSVKSIIRPAEIAFKKYETTRIKVITHGGKLIYKTGAFKFLEDVSGRKFFRQVKGEKGFFIAEAGGRERLYSYARSKGYKDFEGLGWILVMEHDVQEILTPVFQLRNRAMAVSLIFITIVVIIAFLIARSITKPVAMLSKGVGIIGKGDLKHRVEVRTRDEIGELAAAFNEMVEKRQEVENALLRAQDHLEIQVQERTAELLKSNEKLKQEIDERKRAEERINHLNAVLRAIRGVNQIIVKEKDRDRLIKKACEILTSTRGYHHAWMALFDESRNFIAAAEAGVGEKFSRVLEILKRGDLTPWCGKTVDQSGVLMIENPQDDCKGCPLKSQYPERSAVCTRLEYGDKVYGIMSVSLPLEMATDREEQAIFNEVGDDIAFALYAIESEGKERESQEGLRKSEAKYRLLVENAGDAIFIAQDGVLKFVNPSTEALMGYSVEELANMPIEEFIHPEDMEMVLDRHWRRMAGEELPKTYAFRIVNKRGKTRSVHLNTVHTQWLGRPATLNFLRDITEQVRLEAQLAQAQKMEAIGTLTGGIAHDFNNLLTTILGNAELTLMDLAESTPLHGNIEEIRKAAQRAAALTRQLLAFSRKQVIQPEVLMLNEILKGTEKMLRRMIREDIEFLTVFEPELWKVLADPGQMEQVVMNLAVNARDAMPNGGKLTIETANVELDEVYFRDHGVENEPGPYVMLAVTDNGIGMDEETRSRIFEPFFTTKELGRGTGLGLSTVYGIVKQNRGYIWVYTEPGKGTTFKVYFPRTGVDATTIKEERSPVRSFKGSETILIVEDDDSLRTTTSRILKRYGYRVLAAQNGEEAMKISRGHEGPIHLALTDVVMLGMGGRELAERLRSERPEIMIIYMSGYTDNAIAHHGVLDKGVEFIQKPFTAEDLARKVREVMEEGVGD
ncbi:MAG: PAS domain S-box protein [Pseudomonadota bacterium]